MPYIESWERPQYDIEIESLIKKLINKPIGHVNYVISRIIWALFNNKRGYTTGNNLIGVLHCVISEFYRRKLVSYEDEKIAENGDLPEA